MHLKFAAIILYTSTVLCHISCTVYLPEKKHWVWWYYAWHYVWWNPKCWRYVSALMLSRRINLRLKLFWVLWFRFKLNSYEYLCKTKLRSDKKNHHSHQKVTTCHYQSLDMLQRQASGLKSTFYTRNIPFHHFTPKWCTDDKGMLSVDWPRNVRSH